MFGLAGPFYLFLSDQPCSQKLTHKILGSREGLMTIEITQTINLRRSGSWGSVRYVADTWYPLEPIESGMVNLQRVKSPGEWTHGRTCTQAFYQRKACSLIIHPPNGSYGSPVVQKFRQMKTNGNYRIKFNLAYQLVTNFHQPLLLQRKR